MALKLAKFAVDTTPSEFLTWAKLTDGKCRATRVEEEGLLTDLPDLLLVYIDLGDYESVRIESHNTGRWG
jgi:hypothetical protein